MQPMTSIFISNYQALNCEKSQEDEFEFNVVIKILANQYLKANSSVATRTLSVREIWGSIPRPVNRHSVANDSPPLRRSFGAV